MSSSLIMVGSLIMIVGVVPLIFVGRRVGLFAFDGTLYRHRLYYTMALFILISLTNSFYFAASLPTLLPGVAVGIPLGVIYILWYRNWLHRHLDGTVLRYKQNQYGRNLLWCVPICIIAFAFGWFGELPSFFHLGHFVVTIHVMWFILVVYSFYDLRKREAELGEAIIESSEPVIASEVN